MRKNRSKTQRKRGSAATTTVHEVINEISDRSLGADEITGGGHPPGHGAGGVFPGRVAAPARMDDCRDLRC